MRKISIMLLAVFVMAAQAQQITVDTSVPVKLNVSSKQSFTSESKPEKVEGLSSIQRAVGYITDNNPDSITFKGAYVGAAGTYPVAAEITAEMLEPFVGCKVVGVRLAAAQSLGKTNVFLYPLLPNGNAANDGMEKSQRIYEGWNNVFFNGDTSWEIVEGQSILVGYEYNETAAMVEAAQGGICTVGESKGNDFLIYNDYGNGLAWYRISSLGALCVQLIVDVSNMPEKALELQYLDTGFRYKKAGENVEMYVVVGNVGRTDVNSFKIVCQIDDLEPVTFDYQEVIREQGNSQKQPQVLLPFNISVGKHVMSVKLLPEQAIEPTGNKDVLSTVFYVYDKFVKRQQNYVEQYNSQNEYMASLVNPLFDQAAKDNETMILVNVYDKASPLAIDDANYLHDLYAYTVPSFTINRSYFPGEEHIAYDLNYYVELYSSIVPGIIKDLVSQDLAQPAFSTIELTPSYNAETRQLDIEVRGNLVEGGLDIMGIPAVTLMLTEDNVPSKQVVVNAVTGRTSTQQNYMHKHVLRKYVTSPLGNQVSMYGSGNQFEAHFSTTIDPNWNVDNMTLVGIVTRAADEVTDDNVMQMDVTNCCSVRLSELSGIKIVNDTNDTVNAEWFTLDGRRVSSNGMHPGIYLVRQGSATKKVVVR